MTRYEALQGETLRFLDMVYPQPVTPRSVQLALGYHRPDEPSQEEVERILRNLQQQQFIAGQIDLRSFTGWLRLTDQGRQAYDQLMTRLCPNHTEETCATS
jgi:hypothetical protein